MGDPSAYQGTRTNLSVQSGPFKALEKRLETRSSITAVKHKHIPEKSSTHYLIKSEVLTPEKRYVPSTRRVGSVL